MTIKTRCIHIFPRFEATSIIENIRKKYDSLHGCIEPHITLVFPFESTLTKEELLHEVKHIIGKNQCFQLSTEKITAIINFGNFLFLNIGDGTEQLKELHYKLYSGLLNKYHPEWLKTNTFKPHITIGRFKEEKKLLAAYESLKTFDHKFTTKIDRVYIEIIGDSEESIIEEVILMDNRKKI